MRSAVAPSCRRFGDCSEAREASRLSDERKTRQFHVLPSHTQRAGSGEGCLQCDLSGAPAKLSWLFM